MPPILEDRKHPKKKLSEALAEDKPRLKAQKGLIDKKTTMVKAVGDEIIKEPGETMRPSDVQLEQINKFTRRPVTADEVVAFPTLSCNDIVDRDDDAFTTQCVKDFAALEQPFSSVGKSYMLDHAYSVQNAVGRIFSVDTKKVSGSLFLTNEVYIPNTESNQKLIEDIDFGVNWAVSVGVVLGKSECSVCKSPFSSWGYWCQEGHDKGLFYDPNSTEEDAWGWPLPVDPETSGAIKCVRNFSEPRDFYELSQVFLGAQYFAALEKEPSFAGVMKSVAKGDLPIIGLSAEEAESIPLHREPRKVSEARIQFGVEELEDGVLKWIDGDSLVWVYDPADPESGVLSLGKAASDEQEESNDGEALNDGASGEEVGEVDGEGDSGGGSGDGSEDLSEAGGSVEGSAASEVTAAAGDDEDSDSDDESDEDDSEDEESEDDSEDEDDSETDSEEQTTSTAAVLAAAQKAKLPETVIERITSSNKDGVTSLALAVALEIKALQEQVRDLTPKAVLGEKLIAEKRADAIHWYRIARAEKLDEPVNVDTFTKVLDRIGDDVDILDEVISEQKEAAQKKFPKQVRRSSFPANPNEAEAPADVEFAAESDDKVRRLHG